MLWNCGWSRRNSRGFSPVGSRKGCSQNPHEDPVLGPRRCPVSMTPGPRTCLCGWLLRCLALLDGTVFRLRTARNSLQEISLQFSYVATSAPAPPPEGSLWQPHHTTPPHREQVLHGPVRVVVAGSQGGHHTLPVIAHGHDLRQHRLVLRARHYERSIRLRRRGQGEVATTPSHSQRRPSHLSAGTTRPPSVEAASSSRPLLPEEGTELQIQEREIEPWLLVACPPPRV